MNDINKLVNSFPQSKQAVSPGAAFYKILPLIGLVAVELFCFLPVLKHVGFYLDDWVMLNYLSIAPDGFFDAATFYFGIDPRVVNRPLEVVHFIAMFKMFGVKPLGYHVFNVVLEVISAWLLYLSLSSLSKHSLSSFIATAIFVLYPSHNITHYWVVSSAVTLSLALYLGSLYLCVLAASEQRSYLYYLSAVLYCLSNFNYEVFMPFVSINILVVWYLLWKKGQPGRLVKEGFLVWGLNVFAIAALLVYLKAIMPLLGVAWMHKVSFDPSLMFRTLSTGIELNLPHIAFAYFSQNVSNKLNGGLQLHELIYLLLQSTVFFGISISLLFGNRSETICDNKLKSEDSGPPATPSFLIAIGCLCVVVSYLIFGLNEEYMPVFNTIVNRVNTGASIGLAFIICGFGMFFEKLCKTIIYLKTAQAALLIVGTSAVCFFTLTNWALSMPFIISWQLQSQIMNAVKSKKSQFANAKAILLCNAPRYACEAPVFDGVWDFQSMVRLVLARENIDAGVVSDRMQFSSTEVKDISNGSFVCASYSYDNLWLMISPTCRIMRIHGPVELINSIEKYGLDFEQNKHLPEVWRKQINSQSKLEK